MSRGGVAAPPSFDLAFSSNSLATADVGYEYLALDLDLALMSSFRRSANRPPTLTSRDRAGETRRCPPGRAAPGRTGGTMRAVRTASGAPWVSAAAERVAARPGLRRGEHGDARRNFALLAFRRFSDPPPRPCEAHRAPTAPRLTLGCSGLGPMDVPGRSGASADPAASSSSPQPRGSLKNS